MDTGFSIDTPLQFVDQCFQNKKSVCSIRELAKSDYGVVQMLYQSFDNMEEESISQVRIVFPRDFEFYDS